MSDKELLTIADIQKMTGLTYYKISGLIKSKKLPALNLSSGRKNACWYVRKCDLEALLTPQGQPAPRQRRTVRRRIDADVEKIY